MEPKTVHVTGKVMMKWFIRKRFSWRSHIIFPALFRQVPVMEGWEKVHARPKRKLKGEKTKTNYVKKKEKYTILSVHFFLLSSMRARRSVKSVRVCQAVASSSMRSQTFLSRLLNSRWSGVWCSYRVFFSIFLQRYWKIHQDAWAKSCTWKPSNMGKQRENAITQLTDQIPSERIRFPIWKQTCLYEFPSILLPFWTDNTGVTISKPFQTLHSGLKPCKIDAINL